LSRNIDLHYTIWRYGFFFSELLDFIRRNLSDPLLYAPRSEQPSETLLVRVNTAT